VVSRPSAHLPADLVEDLDSLSRQLWDNRADPVLVTRIVHRCGDLPLRRFVNAAGAIRALLDRSYRITQARPSRIGTWFSPRPWWASQAKLACRVPDLAYIFLLHSDGHLREAAVRHLAAPVPNAFWMAALIHRLNDWVVPVRGAASARIAAAAEQTEPETIARAVVALVDRVDRWGRWAHEAEHFHGLAGRPNVRREIVRILWEGQQGPLSSVLRRLLRTPDFDDALPALAQQARQPAVRATALETLLLSEARWWAGYRRRWIDRSMGVWRREAVIASRPIERVCPADEFVRLGLTDKAAAVRKVAATALVREPALAEMLPDGVNALVEDRNPAVRAIGDFLLRRRQDGG
jgi:hypothetical protein